MEDEDDPFRYRRPQFVYNTRFQGNPRNRGNSCSHFLIKFLFIALFLSVLPLFPSEAPEFISQTVFAQTWELFQLLFVGIALSYGLFCRRKTGEVTPKPQVSRPYGTNILQHSSILDCPNDNPSGICEKNAIPKSFNLSHYRTEPFVVVRKESCNIYDEKPLGLPVRSLRTRIVDSDSSDSDVDEECVSECESDLSCKSSCSNTSSISRAVKDDNLQENVGKSSSCSWNSRPTGVDFMANNGSYTEKFEQQPLDSRSFLSPRPVSCQTSFGFCSWLPESPNLQQQQQPVWGPPLGGLPNMVGVNSWRGDNFCMPFAGFPAQGNGYNVMGTSPSLEKDNFYVPSTVTPPSMPAPTTDFGSRPRVYTHGNVDLSQPSSKLESINSGGGRVGFFEPSAAAPPSVSVPDTDFAPSVKPSMSRNFNDGNVKLSESPILDNVYLGEEKVSSFMPYEAPHHSVHCPVRDSASSIKRVKSRRINGGISPNSDQKGSEKDNDDNATFGESPNLDNGNVAGGKASAFMPSAAPHQPVSGPVEDSASYVKRSKSQRVNRGTAFNTDKQGSEKDNDDNGHLGKSPNPDNGNVSGEKASSFIHSAASHHPVSGLVEGSASSIKRSKSRRINCSIAHNTHEQGSENDKGDRGDLGELLNSDNGSVVGDKASSFMPSAAPHQPVLGTVEGSASSVKQSKSRKFNRGILLKTEEQGSEKGNDDSGGSGKSPNLDDREKAKSFMPSAAPNHPESEPVRNSASSVKRLRSRRTKRGISLKKDGLGSGNDDMEDPGKGIDSSTSHFVTPLPVPTPSDTNVASSVDGSVPKKEEQKSIPTRWDDDCFVIPSLESYDMENTGQENVSHGLAGSSEPGASSSRSSNRQGSPENKVGEDAPVTASTNSSEIEELRTENESYKPSTPSPPPQVQTRRNELTSAIESNSIGFLLSEDDDQGSPPTPKALSRASHSRRFSCVSFFDRDLRRSFSKDEAKEANRKSKRGQNSRGATCGWDCLKLDVKPTLNKAALKGKSVRTIKPREIPLEMSDCVGEKREENGEKNGEKPGMVVIQIGISEKRSSSNGKRGEKMEGSRGTSIMIGLNKQENLKGKEAARASDAVKEVETDNDEIDKKADEFIAKFKQQIRLQKVAATAESSRQQQRLRQSSLLYN